MTILHNQKLWLTKDGRLEVYHHKLATRINRWLKYYDNGRYSFEAGEEGLFKLSQIELNEFITRFLKNISNKNIEGISEYTPN